MNFNKLNPWQKGLAMVATIGVTGTAIYFGIKAVKKMRANYAGKNAKAGSKGPGLEITYDPATKSGTYIFGLTKGSFSKQNTPIGVLSGIPNDGYTLNGVIVSDEYFEFIVFKGNDSVNKKRIKI